MLPAFIEARRAAGTTMEMWPREPRMLSACITSYRGYDEEDEAVQLMKMLLREPRTLPSFIEARGATCTTMQMRSRNRQMLPAFIEARGAAGTMMKMRLRDPRLLWSLSASSFIYIT